MNQETLTEFSGVSGRVLQRSVSGSSLITGVVVGIFVIVGSFVAAVAETPRAATPFSQIIMAFALARFALNGAYGQWNGTIFSTVGGSHAMAAIVALRYLSLTGLWLVPMLAFFVPEQSVALGPAMGGKILVLMLLYLVAMTLTPPVFLIVSVTAQNYADVFSTAHWKQVFGGRLGDLFVIYAVYTGALGMVLVLSVPPVLMAFNVHPYIGFIIGALSVFLLFGMSVNLLGRLCGFYACGDYGFSALRREPQPAADAGGPGGEIPAGLPSGPTAPAVQPIPLASSPATATASTGAAAVAVAAADAELHHRGLPPLLDAPQRVEAALQRFQADPQGAVAALEELTRSFAPDPHVTQALALSLYRAGQVDRGLEAAVTALPLCFERGQALLAAEIYREMRQHLNRLELDREQLLTIAVALLRKDDLAGGAKAFSSVIALDAEEARAIKGLLQVADAILQKKGKPEVAIKIYRYLLQHCAASPLAEFMHEGLKQAERRLERAPAAN